MLYFIFTKRNRKKIGKQKNQYSRTSHIRPLLLSLTIWDLKNGLISMMVSKWGFTEYLYLHSPHTPLRSGPKLFGVSTLALCLPSHFIVMLQGSMITWKYLSKYSICQFSFSGKKSNVSKLTPFTWNDKSWRRSYYSIFYSFC